MDAIEAIRTRRMIPRVREDRPSREEVEELLELAVRAPNHHFTEPWRFHVLAGEGRDRLARAIAAEESERKGGAIEDHLELGRSKVERAPVIVVVTCQPSQDDKVVEQEEICSAAMAMQNLLLGAWAKGLGAMLRTGTVAYHRAAADHLDLEPGEQVVGFVYLGYPAADRQLTPRKPAAEKTRWVGWD